MERLSNNWLTENVVDFEYKKYVLLAYLQQVEKRFRSKELYPHLPELRFQYSHTADLQSRKNLLKKYAQGQLIDIDWQKLELIYEKTAFETAVMRELDDIINYALPQLASALQVGEEIKADVAQDIQISPVGIEPLYKKEGYLFVYEEFIKEILVLYFKLSVYADKNDTYKSINTQLIEKRKYTFSDTFESLKLQLIKANHTMPNPATYLIHIKKVYPFESTLLPLVKEKVAVYLEQNDEI